MFKDKYKNDVERIQPDKELVDKVYEQIKAEDSAVQSETKKQRKYSYRFTYRIAAAVLCFVMVITASGVGLINNINGNKQDIVNTPINTNRQANQVNMEIKDAKSYGDIFGVIKEMADSQYNYTDGLGSILDESLNESSNGRGQDVKPGAAAPSYTSAPSSNEDSVGQGQKDYSNTNEQVEGVSEADVMKTDGDYIYYLSKGYIIIVKAESGKMNEVSRIKVNNEQTDSQYTVYENANDFYVKDDMLVVIQRYNVSKYYGYDNYGYDNRTASDAIYMIDYFYGNEDTKIKIYDISDRSAPVLKDTVGQNGACLSTRMVGDILYVVSNYYINNYSGLDKDKPETYIPSVINNDEYKLMNSQDIYACTNIKQLQYLIITSIDIKNADEYIDMKSVLGGGTQMYVTTENILMAINSYDYIQEKIGNNNYYISNRNTTLMSFELDKGKITYKAKGKIKGSLLNQFSMDEYEDHFRIVTTLDQYAYADNVYDANLPREIYSAIRNGNATANSLYILDKDLQIKGSLENLAKNERVYSVRFDGDIGYFVTFRQVDPLFTVDLSEPTAPKILSELKIPGFSEYLHPYSDDLLFGLGKNADPNTGATLGMKLSMFDVSDKSNVSEKDIISVVDAKWSEASYNHKAILISPERGLIAFYTGLYYMVYSYTEGEGFELVKRVNIGGYQLNVRGLYINDVFYVCSENNMQSYSMDNYELISKISI